MKKGIIILSLALTMGFSAFAQFTDWGVRFGLGAATISDDLLTRSPVCAMDLGGYVNYGFENTAAFWADNLYLQLGANIVRRGARFEQVWELQRSYREGFYHLNYFEIPVLAAWKMELPFAEAEHYANLYVGPALGVGFFGRIWDRHVTPGFPQTSVNYDTYESQNRSDKKAFKHMRRFDISSRIGIGYKHNTLTVDLFWEHGFISLMKEQDVLRTLDAQSTENNNNNNNNTDNNINPYTGVNNALVLSIGYTLPLK
ncbi:MAG: PorT family protein [Bacteroidales bacterium]|nr:PorT family protein [Bacteroidales bacterium]